MATKNISKHEASFCSQNDCKKKKYFSTLLTLRTTIFWCVKKGALREYWLHRFYFLINCSHKGLICKTTHLLKGSNHGTKSTTMKQCIKVSIHVPWKYVKRLYNILGLCLWHVQTYWRSDRRPENLSFGDFILLGKSFVCIRCVEENVRNNIN